MPVGGNGSGRSQPRPQNKGVGAQRWERRERAAAASLTSPALCFSFFMAYFCFYNTYTSTFLL